MIVSILINVIGFSFLILQLKQIKKEITAMSEQDVKLGEAVSELKTAIGAVVERIDRKLDEVKANCPEVQDDIEAIKELTAEVNGIMKTEDPAPTDVPSPEPEPEPSSEPSADNL